jgi:hypothetical protein
VRGRGSNGGPGVREEGGWLWDIEVKSLWRLGSS